MQSDSQKISCGKQMLQNGFPARLYSSASRPNVTNAQGSIG